MHFHDFPRQMEEYYVQRVRRILEERCRRLAAIRTSAQVRRYQESVRRGLRRAFGPFPKRTPLNPRVLRTSDFGAYTVEHVLFESRPGFLVSGVLYLPRVRSGRVPGVLFTSGHAPEAKAYPRYVRACVRLVRAGFAVLAYDPIHQGERDLFSRLNRPDRPTRNEPCVGHNIVGKQLHACGEWFGAWRAWDGIRSLDYLLSRPEVNPRCVGVAGQSGGGTLSAYLWALDRRLRMVASSCWLTSYGLDLENSMPADDEQYPPGWLAAGLDKADFFLARAGEPTLLLGQTLDFFDNRGLEQAYAELLRLHRLVGAPKGMCRLFMDQGTHELSDASQLEMVRFFCTVAGIPPPHDDQPEPVPDEAALRVTPEGDVHAHGSWPLYEGIRTRAATLVGERRGRLVAGDLSRRIRSVLRIPGTVRIPHHRRLFHTASDRPNSRQRVFRFLVETEPGILCVLRRVCGAGEPFRLSPSPVARLYLPNVCSQRELGTPQLMEGVDDFWMLDVRGLGEGLSAPEDPLAWYGHEYMAAGYAVLLGETLLGRRVFDVLATVKLLRAEGAREIHLAGRGQGAILALVAGVLDRSIATVSCREAPESIQALVSAPLCRWPAVNFPRGILHAFDLPDLRQALGPRLKEDTRSDAESFAL